MGSQSNALAEHIRLEREELAKDINELESRVREQPRRWFLERLPRITAVVFGVCFLIGFLAANRRLRRY